MNNKILLYQFIFSFTIVIFCMFQIKYANDSAVYLSLISSILGYWLPSPMDNKYDK